MVPQNPQFPTAFSVYLIGEIKRGDYEKFLGLLQQHGTKIRAIVLRSQGGNAYEAIKIGRAVRALMLDSSAPINDQGCTLTDREAGINARPCTCASACFFIFVAGVRRTGLQLVLHRARFTSEEMAALSHDEYKGEYDKVLQATKAYLREMDVPDKFYSQMIAVSSRESKKVSDADALELMNIPASDEWLTARCGMFTAEEYHALSQFYIRKSQGAAFKQLKNKMDTINLCRNDRIDEAREIAFKKFQARELTR